MWTTTRRDAKEMSMKVKVFFAWYDFWVGMFFDRDKRVLYICPLPMLVIRVRRR